MIKKILAFLLYLIPISILFTVDISFLNKGDLGGVIEGLAFLIYITSPVIIVSSFIYGVFRGFNLLIPIVTAASFYLIARLTDNVSISYDGYAVFSLIYAVCAFSGNAIGGLIFKKKKK